MKNQNLFALIIAFLAWFGVIMQFMVFEIPISNYLSYFTVQTNTLIAISMSLFLWKNENPVKKALTSHFWLSALAEYIVIVALIYNVYLRWGWPTVGLQTLADNIVHILVPVLYIIFWYKYIPKGSIYIGQVFKWLAFPLVYLIYTLVLGYSTQWYPYPFMDINKLSYGMVILNSLVISGFYLGIGFLLKWVNGRKK